MKKSFLLSFLFSALIIGAAYQVPAWGVTAQDVSSVSTLNTVTAKVMKIDYDLRRVTLETTEGKRVTLKVGKEAKNFNQVKVGDMVQAKYYESIAWEILPPGSKAEPEVTKSVATASVPKGEKPDVDAIETITVVGSIDKIDQPNSMVVIKGPDGVLMPVKVRYPDKLKDVKVGDKVAAKYTEALAIAVEPAPKSK